MTARPASPRVLLLADDEATPTLEDILASLSCVVDVAADAFDGMASADEDEPDVILLDFTMARDDARVLAYWVRDNDVDAPVVGIVEPVLGAADADLDELCDELVLAPATSATLAAALGLDPPRVDERRQLTVKVNAALLDAHEVGVPPEQATTDDGAKPALIVGLGAHAEAPRHVDD